MSENHRLLVFFAHPDDESFGFAGTLSALTDAGIETTYVCATRGEVGEILVDGLTTPDELGPYREGELRNALELLGVNDLRLLGFRDSGMDGTEPNQHANAFMNQDVEALTTVVAEIIVEKRPTIVLTYGPDGIYGHPDHIMAHKVGLPAVHKAAEMGWQVPNLYYSSASRERVMRSASQPDHPFAKMDPELVATMGTPAAEITTWLDTSAYWERKLAALRAHRTQVGDNGPFPKLSDEDRQFWLSIESARMVPLPWNPNPKDVLLELLPEAPKDHPFRA